MSFTDEELRLIEVCLQYAVDQAMDGGPLFVWQRKGTGKPAYFDRMGEAAIDGKRCIDLIARIKATTPEAGIDQSRREVQPQ